MTKVPRNGLAAGPDGKLRCFWGVSTPDYVDYHDREWGYPVTDDRRLFEKLCLEGFQAGLSWITILRKREAFRRAFAGFEPAAVARFGARDVKRLLGDAGIVRHRGKIESTINNAGRALEVIAEHGSLAAYVWRFVPAAADRNPGNDGIQSWLKSTVAACRAATGVSKTRIRTTCTARPGPTTGRPSASTLPSPAHRKMRFTFDLTYRYLQDNRCNALSIRR
jgi:DNA-3-methyladenine glycosylase I